MDIGIMLDLLVDNHINNMILGYENNLRVILTDEGVSVNDEDNMDSLIAKVDEEFDNRISPAGDAVAADVASGKTFINSSGQLITGTGTMVSGGTNSSSSKQALYCNTGSLRTGGDYNSSINIINVTAPITCELTFKAALTSSASGFNVGGRVDISVNDTIIKTISDNFPGGKNSASHTFNVNKGDVINIKCTKTSGASTSGDKAFVCTSCALYVNYIFR
jgi:hypothetical protein